MSTPSPNMSLIIPSVGVDAGPKYAIEVNQSLTTIDQHNHSPGSGVQINPDGININTSLTFQNNLATNLQGVNFYLQTSSSSVAQTLYVKNGSENTPLPDLWYYDGTNQIQITSGGTLASVPTTVAGLSYSGGTFTFVQGAGSTTPANLSIGSVTIRPNTASTTYGVVLGPPASIASQYDVQLPLVPAATSFMTMDTSGDMLTTIPTANGITRSNLAAVGQQISSSATQTVTAGSYTAVTNLNVSITTTGRPVMIFIQPDGSGSPMEIGSTRSGSATGNIVSQALVALSRDGTISPMLAEWLFEAQIQSTASNLTVLNIYPNGSFTFLDTPSAGSHTYQIYTLTDATNVAFVNAKLVAYEL